MRRALRAIARVIAFVALAQSVLTSQRSAAQDVEARVRVRLTGDVRIVSETGDGVLDEHVSRWLHVRRRFFERCAAAAGEVTGVLTVSTRGRTSFVVTSSGLDGSASACFGRVLGAHVFSPPSEGPVTYGRVSEPARDAAVTYDLSFQFVAIPEPLVLPTESPVLEVRVLEIEGVRGRRLPALYCGVVVAVVRVRVEVLRAVVGELGFEPTWLRFGACAADALRDRRIVGRDVFVHRIAGTWWVDEDFDPDAVAD